jgi:WD40 repeat protein/tRNA A-37 threonylcarbamoyl transferase component Bud32
MSDPLFPCAADLVAALQRWRLLEPAQLEEVERSLLPQFAEAQGLAEELVRRAWLTPFQVNQLFKDKGNELLVGSYVLLEKLGEGGMGAVYKAHNWKLGTIVAVKRVHKERLVRSETLGRFRHEIRAAALLAHPNIVRALDADEVDGVHFLVMEYVEGQTLHQLVRIHGPLPVPLACDYARQAALGLQHLHEQGLVHRDLKPSNLLVDLPAGAEPPFRGGTVKVLDLGLAHLNDELRGEDWTTLTREGIVLGTPDFMAPEQTIDAHSVDIRADLYSLGCTLYFLLVARAPFQGGSLGQKIAHHQSAEPPALQSLRPTVPAEVVAVVRRLMAKRPEDRYQTPAETAQALQEAMIDPAATGGVGVERSTFTHLAPPTVVPGAVLMESAARAQRRKLLLAVLGVFVVLAVGVWLWARFGRTRTPADTGPRTEAEQRAADWQQLLERADTADAQNEEFRAEVVTFWLRHPATPEAAEAMKLLGRLPSPLDRLNPEHIPAEERKAAGRGEVRRTLDGLVAVWGDSRLKHWDRLTGAAWSPDGKRIASSGFDEVVRVWDASTGRELLTLRGHAGLVYAVAYSRGGKWLASCGLDRTVRIWKADTGEPVRLLRGHTSTIITLAFGRDEDRLVSAGLDRLVKVWDVEKGTALLDLKGHTDRVEGVCFSPDGGQVASASFDQTVRVWDARSGRSLRTLRVPGVGLMSVAWSPDGKQLVAGTRMLEVRVWDAMTGDEIQSLRGINGSVACVAFSPDGSRLAGMWPDGVRVWETKTWNQERHLPGVLDGARGLAFSPDGKRLVVADSFNVLEVWNLQTGRKTRDTSDHVARLNSLCFSPDGTQLASASQDRTLCLWDTAGSKPRVLRGHTAMPTGVAVSPAGTWLASVGLDPRLRLWDMAGRSKEKVVSLREGIMYAVCFSPDGQEVVVGGQSGSVQARDAWTGDFLRAYRGDRQLVRTVAYSPDGRHVAAGSAPVRIWEARTGEELVSWLAHPHSLRGLCFHPDGKLLASAGEDGTVKLWDVGSARAGGPVKEVRTLLRIPAAATSVCFNRDGTRLVASTADGRVIVWDTDSGDVRHSWQLPGAVQGVVFSPDGRHVATANGNGTLYVFRRARPKGGTP